MRLIIFKKMPVSYINHQNRKILYVNLEGLKDKEVVMDHLDQMADAYRQSLEKIYLLLDVRGTYTDPEVMDKLKNYGKSVFNGKSEKRAILGVDGLKKLLLKGYSMFTGTKVEVFDTVDQAKNYLAQN